MEQVTKSAGTWKKLTKGSKPIMIDGSMGTALILNGLPKEKGSLFKKLWAASALADDQYHDLVVKSHVDYIEAGSTVLSTNSYATQPNYYEETFGKDKYENLMLEHAKLSAEFAVKARKKYPEKDILILGSLGPICESHQPGRFMKYLSEKGDQFCIDTYCKLTKALYDGGVDAFLLETMNNWKETELGLEGIKKFKNNAKDLPHLPIYVSLEGALRNDNLQPVPEKLGSVYLKKFLQYFDDNPSLGIECYGLNCSAPEELKETLDFTFQKTTKDSPDLQSELKKRDLGLCIYANLNDRKETYLKGYDRSSDDVEAIKLRQDLVGGKHAGFCNSFEEIVKEYPIVTHIGGCCGCGPDGIKSLHDKFFKT